MNKKITNPSSDCRQKITNFKIDVPEYYNFACEVVDAWAAVDRNRLAMINVDQAGTEKRLTFHDFSRLSNQAANFLLDHGVKQGDRVFLMLPRIPEWWIFSLALIKIGAVQSPSPCLLTPKDIKQRINQGNFCAVITNSENVPKFDAVYGQCPSLNLRIVVGAESADWVSYHREVGRVRYSRQQVMTPFPVKTKSSEPMLILFTSGTNRHPKMVLHNHSYPLGHRITAELWQNLGPNDLHFTISDTGWGKNMWGNYFGQWNLGTCVFVYDIRGKFHAAEILPLLEKYEITSFCAPPTIYRMLVLSDLKKFDFRELRHCLAAGEPLHVETSRLWEEGTGLKIYEGYGQTETVCMIAHFQQRQQKPGSMGTAAPGWRIEIHDDSGKPLPPGEDGCIAVNLATRPTGLLAQYLNSPKANSASFINGFYYTGDKACCDKDGYFWFRGRDDDMIKSSGYRIGPLEVEEALMAHPAVHEVGVIGVPDPIRGARVKAYIVLNPGFEATESLVRELQAHTKELTAPYKYPREIEFLETLPKTHNGKIKRDLLRLHAKNGKI
ncbi:MAG: AMP-binding protein [Victivallales bacterium]|nr:AMP-binding protein [Victivallales bacterium]